jgi:hypothetical protein
MEQAATTKVPIGAPCGKASWFGRSVARSVPRAWGSVARSPCRRPGAPDGRKAFCVSARDRGVRRVGRRNSARQEVGSGEASWRVYQRREQKLIGQRPCSGALLDLPGCRGQGASACASKGPAGWHAACIDLRHSTLARDPRLVLSLHELGPWSRPLPSPHPPRGRDLHQRGLMTAR